jgi:TonB family protein
VLTIDKSIAATTLAIMVISIVAAGLALIFLDGSQAGPSAPQPVEPATWFSNDDYPADAVRGGQAGQVNFSVQVDAKGAPSSCSIAKSSGSPSLDAVTCSIIMRKAHFVPAHGPSGSNIASRYDGRVSWSLPAPPSNALNSVVELGGSIEHPRCALVVDGKPRQLIPEMCRSLASSIVARGGKLDQPVRVSIPLDSRYLTPESK